VIGRGQQHDGVRVLAQQEVRRQRRRRGGVAPARLKDDGLGADVNCAQLLGDDEPVAVVANDNGIGERAAVQSFSRFLQQAYFRNQTDQLLGIQFPGKGPKPLSRTAGKNDRNDCFGHG